MEVINKKNVEASMENHPYGERAQALILAAYRTIAEKGFEGLRVRDVAAQVGINPATLHHYFPTKEELIQGVVVYVTQRLADTATPSDEGTAVERLRNHLALLRRRMQDEPELPVVLNEISLRAGRDSTINSILQWRMENWHSYLLAVLQTGIQQGEWPDDLDAEAAASAFIALIRGVSMNASMPPERAEQALRQLKLWLKL